MSRVTHTGKSRAEKEYYKKEIQNVGYEPTVDDSLSFPVSDDTEEDLRVSETQRMQRVKLPQKVAEHFQNNWIGWVIGSVALVLIFFIFNFNRDVGRVEGRLDSLSENVNKIESSLLESFNENRDREIQISENKIRLDFLEKSIDKLGSE